jgi:hypothetical protein
MTLLLHLWHLQKSDYYDTLWQKPGKDYYYTYDMTIIAIMTFLIYHDTYVYYNTVISIIAFWSLNYYYTYDIEVLLFAIMTIAKHYVHYIHYDTIISIMTFWFIITLMTLRYYFRLLWQL